MHGLVSLLDDAHTALVEELWAGLAERCGLRAIYQVPYPHFSYHVAEDYDLARLEAIVQAVASETAPFRVRAGSLGIFTGLAPVLVIPVVRGLALSHLHERLWYDVAGAAVGINAYYHPDRWVPHITLASHDTSPAGVAEAVRWLGERAFTWDIPITNLALIHDPGASAPHTLRFRYPLRGG